MRSAPAKDAYQRDALVDGFKNDRRLLELDGQHAREVLCHAQAQA